MTVLLVDQQRLIHFSGGIEDAEIWITTHNDEFTDLIVVQEDEYDEKFQHFLDANAPILIQEK